MKYLFAISLEAALMTACTIQANVGTPKITVDCVELVQGGQPIEKECAGPDAGSDAQPDASLPQ